MSPTRFSRELADAVEEAASEGGFGLSLCITRNRLEREALYLSWLDTQHLDGLIFATNRPDDGSLKQLIGERSNIVLIDEDVPGVDVPKVFVDNVEGGYLATKHLIDAGHTTHRPCHRAGAALHRARASRRLSARARRSRHPVRRVARAVRRL